MIVQELRAETCENAPGPEYSACMAELRHSDTNDVLRSYRRWKEEGAELKARAQGLLVERFHELVREAQQVQHDLHEDFGHTVKFPVNPKFAKKGKARPAARKVAAGIAAPANAGLPPAVTAPAVKASPVQKASGGTLAPRVSPTAKTTPVAISRTPKSAKKETGVRELERLTRQVEKARQRLAEAKVSGGPVKIQNAEDRLYELSDELRLLTARQTE